jgi:ribosomal protein L10
VQEAALNKQLEIAKNAIRKGANNNFVAEITGLTIEQIAELRNRN